MTLREPEAPFTNTRVRRVATYYFPTSQLSWGEPPSGSPGCQMAKPFFFRQAGDTFQHLTQHTPHNGNNQTIHRSIILGQSTLHHYRGAQKCSFFLALNLLSWFFFVKITKSLLNESCLLCFAITAVWIFRCFSRTPCITLSLRYNTKITYISV